MSSKDDLRTFYQYDIDVYGRQKISTNFMRVKNKAIERYSVSTLNNDFSTFENLVMDIERVKIISHEQHNSGNGVEMHAFLLGVEEGKIGLLVLDNKDYDFHSISYEDAFMSALNEIVVFDSVTELVKYSATSFKYGLYDLEGLKRFYAPLKNYMRRNEFHLITSRPNPSLTF